MNYNGWHCQCLYEIENGLPRTKFCFMACKAQRMILHERFKEQQDGKNEQNSNEETREISSED